MRSRKAKLLFMRSKLLKENLEFHEEVLFEATLEFRKEFEKKYIEKNKSEQGDNTEERTQTVCEKKPENNILSAPKEESLKKLYKKIALKTHPDRLRDAELFERDLKEELFESAKQALVEDDIATLCYIAQKLDLELPEFTDEHIYMMKNNNKKMEKKIKNIASSYAWVWFHQGDSLKKQKLMEEYAEKTNYARA